MRRIPPRRVNESYTLEVLQQHLPDAVIDTDFVYTLEPFNTVEARGRLDAAGVGLLTLIEKGTTKRGYFRLRTTPQIMVLDIIADYTEAGILNGVLEKSEEGIAFIKPVEIALRDIVQGTFDARYARFYDRLIAGQVEPGQQG